MNDSLNILQYTNPYLHSVNKQGVGDILNLSDLPSGVDTFLQEGHVAIVPNELMGMQLDLFSYLLIFFIALLTTMRWFMPERFLFEFTVSKRLTFKRKNSDVIRTPSLVVDVIYLLNFLFTISLLTYLFFANYLAYLFLLSNKLFLYIVLAYLLFWMYRRVVIQVISFVFSTKEIAKQQINLDSNIKNALSVALLPMLLLTLFSFQEFFLLSSVIMALGMQVFRWFQTVIIGISNTRFSAFHFILYLCTLELIPVLIMIKLISPSNYF